MAKIVPAGPTPKQQLKTAYSLLVRRLEEYGRQAGNWIHLNWFRLLIIGLLTFILLKKDVRFQLDLQNGSYLPLTTDLARTAAYNEEEVLQQSAAVPLPLSAEKNKQLAYVHRFATVARQEMKRFGIPASITLAQGLLETNAGRSPLATRNNNHFGIKCFSRSCSKGHCSNFEDDTHKDFFRHYDSAWESYRAHSLFLKNGERYQSLFNYGRDNYKDWAKGLGKAGYATDSDYAQKLIRLIEELGLQEYDA
ncbi:MAG: glucosaminidase domain-containing protein [Saprospiraceae bacterium]